MGRPPSPKKSQQGETSDRQDDLQEHGHIISDPNTSCRKVEFSRWEEGDSIGWIACAERYFWFYRTIDATRVEIAVIHLEREMLFSDLIGMNTPMEVSLGSDSRMDYLIASDQLISTTSTDK
ncbi:hypothetical protein B296_00008005 [Ensete ventricosum]|uniref:Uncharacterized protein n=1 Tax=Ensete ventricosum TaxID=4639 RepID=A0A427AYL0_ENSVE|nr:hypothetical protein B296_00008005 [Ensete ventricosum]